MTDREEKNLYQREYRLRTKNKCTLKYERSIAGFLMRKYRNMKSRILGIQAKKKHLYVGKTLLSKDDFYLWAFTNSIFIKLYYEWVSADYARKLCPTVDRIDSSKGYTLDNMCWLTHSENSRRGAQNRWQKF